MYCPKCGQQQISDEMRFCSRCGLALSGLAEWLAGSPPPPPKRVDEVQTEPLSPRRKSLRRAAKLMFWSAALFPLFLVWSIAEDEPGPLIVPFVLFFVSLVWMVYVRIFSDKTVPMINHSVQTSFMEAAPLRSALPPAITPPIPNTGRQQVRTNELAQPPSVTEHTTRLLDNE
jgi:hypothetical protein